MQLIYAFIQTITSLLKVLSKITIYHNPRCGKSRNTLKILQEARLDFKIVEYLKNPPGVEELSEVLEKLGISPIDLIRKGESEYKNLIKGKTLSDRQLIELMSQNPILIERPVVFNESQAIIGRPPENVLQIIS